MQVKNWLRRDDYLLGVILGLIIPIPVYFLFIILVGLAQEYMHILGRIRQTDLFLLGIAVNLVVMRHYMVKLRFEKTGKALLVLTVILILSFFIFLKNSNFTIDF